jgi:hypothetical protein
MAGKLGTGGRGGISGNIPFLSRLIQLWNKLPMNDLGTFPSNRAPLERGLGK